MFLQPPAHIASSPPPGHHLPKTPSEVRVCRSLKIFAKIDPKYSVDKLNKSKLTGNNIVNVFKMVLSLVTWLAAGGGAAPSA